MRSGMGAEEAVDDIVLRGVSELRKNAFGDDVEDAKSLPWSREQAWTLMKQLSKQTEVRPLAFPNILAGPVIECCAVPWTRVLQIPYHEVLLEFPFKGDETPLRHMEHAELITIGTLNGTKKFVLESASGLTSL